MEKAIDQLVGQYLEHSLVYLSKEMWRQAMAISTQQPDSPFGHTYSSLDVAMANQTSKLISKLQVLGLLREDIDTRSIGELIFNNTNMMFIVFVKASGMTLRELRAAIRRQNRVLLACIAKEQ